MNHIRNIKEMLSIPTGSRNVSTSGYSSITDSQIFFGSQFWPDNSQATSQDMSVSSRTSQQSSQGGSDPKFTSSYHTKPLLFGELNDKCKGFGILEFEEDKKRAKENADSDILAKECKNFQETLKNIQQLVAGTEKNTAECQIVLEKIDNFASTMQNDLNSLQSDISQQFETLLNKVASQKETLIDLEERVLKRDSATAELCSKLQSLKDGLESLKEEQKREQEMVGEALKLLSTLVSEQSGKRNSERVMDSAIQTSPGLELPFNNILQDKKLGSTLTATSNNLEHNKAEVPPRDPSCIIGRSKSLTRRRKRKKRPLVLSQRSKHAVTDENRQAGITIQDGLSSDSLNPPKREMRPTAAGCVITPHSYWSQDSNSSVCLPDIEPILEKLSAAPVNPEGTWQQLFGSLDYDCCWPPEEE